MAACREAVGKARIHPQDIVGIGLATQSGSVILLDAEGRLVRPMISWLDRRSLAEIEEIQTCIPSGEYYEITGRLPSGSEWILPDLLWLRKHEPDNWRRTAKVLQLQDVALHAYGDEGYHEDIPECGKFGLWDVRKVAWSDTLLSLFEIDPAILPEPALCGTMVARIPKRVAQQTGFAEGTPVSVGGRDTILFGVGAGLVEPGIACVNLGTSGVLAAFMAEPYMDASSGMVVNNHAMPGRWQMEGIVPTAGACYRWFRDNLGTIEEAEADERGLEPYALLNALAAEAPVGCNSILFLPYLAGSYAPYWDARLRACYLGLGLFHDRACMARAVMEGVAMHMRKVIDCMEAVGVRIEKLRILGGATSSPLWNQIQADVYGRPCEKLRETRDATALGAAILGGVGARVFRDIPEGVRSMVRVAEQIDPIEGNVPVYDSLFEIFTSAVDLLREGGVFRALSEMQA